MRRGAGGRYDEARTIFGAPGDDRFSEDGYSEALFKKQRDSRAGADEGDGIRFGAYEQEEMDTRYHCYIRFDGRSAVATPEDEKQIAGTKTLGFSGIVKTPVRPCIRVSLP